MVSLLQHLESTPQQSVQLQLLRHLPLLQLYNTTQGPQLETLWESENTLMQCSWSHDMVRTTFHTPRNAAHSVTAMVISRLNQRHQHESPFAHALPPAALAHQQQLRMRPPYPQVGITLAVLWTLPASSKEGYMSAHVVEALLQALVLSVVPKVDVLRDALMCRSSGGTMRMHCSMLLKQLRNGKQKRPMCCATFNCATAPTVRHLLQPTWMTPTLFLL